MYSNSNATTLDVNPCDILVSRRVPSMKGSKMHSRNGSIKNHLQKKHTIRRVERKILLDATTVLARCPEKRRLKLMEALLIKSEKPEINSQLKNDGKIFKKFVH